MPDTVVLRDGDTVYVQKEGAANPSAWVGVTNIDWLELAHQKHRLVTMIWDNPDDILWGIVHLIDAIQDQAVEDGLPVVHAISAQIWKEEHADDNT